MVRPEASRTSLLEDDIAVAAHADLQPISRFFDSGGHDFDEGVLRQAMLAKQQADLKAAQREGWIPPMGRLGALLPCFAAATSEGGGGGEEPRGALSTATSGLTAMDTDEGSGELAAATAAALASQEEREAAAAAAEAARQARRQARRAERERRRQQLLQEKKEAKARARAEAQKRYADQHQRWEAAVADKRQQVEDLQRQAAEAGEGIRSAEERAKGLEERKHALFLQLKQALDEEQAERQRKQRLAAMEEGEVAAASPPAAARGAGAAPPPAGTAAAAAPAASGGGGGVRSPSYGGQYLGSSGGFDRPHGYGPLGPPREPPLGGFAAREPGDRYGGGGGGGFYGRGGPAAGGPGERGELFGEDSRTRDAWGVGGGGGGGSAASTPRGPREGLPPSLGGTPLAGDRERDRGEFAWPREFRGGAPGGPGMGGGIGGGPGPREGPGGGPGGGGGGRDWGWRGSFEDRRPPRDYASRDHPPSGGSSRDGLGLGPSGLSREFGERREREREGGPPPPRGYGPPGGPAGPGPAGRPRLSYEERERLRREQAGHREPEGLPPHDRPLDRPLDRPHYGSGSRDAWEHSLGSREAGGGSRDAFERPGGGGGYGADRGGGRDASREGFPAGFGRPGRGREWAGPGGGAPGGGGGREREGGGGGGIYREPPRGR